MKSPVLANGSYESLVSAIRKSQISYPAFCWLTDTTQWAFVNKRNQIEIIGVSNLTGTMDSPIILAELADGIYNIKGHYKTNTDSELAIPIKNMLAIVSSTNVKKKVKCITEEDIIDYAYDSETGKAKTSNYVTSDGLTDIVKDEVKKQVEELISLPVSLIETLPSGETTLTVTDEVITDNARFAVYADKYGVVLNDMYKEENTLTLIFSPEEEDVQVKILINDDREV